MLADQAFRTISAGLDKEQHDGDSAAALELYKRGVRDLKSALRIQFATQDEKYDVKDFDLCIIISTNGVLSNL
jgi:hypothetical protein